MPNAMAITMYVMALLSLGVEITVAPGVTRNHGILTLGEGGRSQSGLDRVASRIIVDRSYVHGHPTLNVNRCIALNSAASAVIDSYISECHAKGFDSQAICGWNGPGPFKITNNYLEGAGEIVMFGGADPFIRNLTPSDIEVHAAYGRVDDADALHAVTTIPMELEQADGSRHWFTATVPLERTGAFGYTVRVVPTHPQLVSPVELGLVTYAS